MEEAWSLKARRAARVAARCCASIVPCPTPPWLNTARSSLSCSSPAAVAASCSTRCTISVLTCTWRLRRSCMSPSTLLVSRLAVLSYWWMRSCMASSTSWAFWLSCAFRFFSCCGRSPSCTSLSNSWRAASPMCVQNSSTRRLFSPSQRPDSMSIVVCRAWDAAVAEAEAAVPNSRSSNIWCAAAAACLAAWECSSSVRGGLMPDKDCMWFLNMNSEDSRAPFTCFCTNSDHTEGTLSIMLLFAACTSASSIVARCPPETHLG
mmetsp:Transcript_41740/g.78113  ORF Transcript_41740/g.78113 Transcript_41740/m.78113 type:complete len:263 (-) Transcript_41740:427-1215(-)